MRIKVLCLAAALSCCAVLHAQTGGVVIGNGGAVNITGGGGGGSNGNATSIQGKPVSATAPTDQQALIFDVVTGLWLPKTISAGSVGTCSSGYFVKALTAGAAPTCAQVQYSQISGAPVNTVVTSGTPASGQFAQFVDTKTVQAIGATGTGQVVLDTSPTVQTQLTVSGANTGINNNGANWISGAGSPSGSCAPGSVYSNTASTTSCTAVYICFGSWAAVCPSTSNSTTKETVGNLGEYDFDGNDTGPTLVATGTPTTVTTNVYTAPNAVDFNATADYYTSTFTTSTATLYARAEIRANTESTGSIRLFDIYGGNAELGTVYLSANSGYLTIHNNATASDTLCASSGTAFTSATYHLVEFQWIVSATAGGLSAKIDGTTTCNVSGVNTGTANVTSVRFGEVQNSATPWDVEFDNVGFSSSGWMGGVTP